jgi:ion channel-forming bestrophin family protein
MKYNWAWFRAIFDFFRTDTLKKTALRTIFVGIYATIVVYSAEEIFFVDFVPPAYIIYLLGVVLSYLLVLRTYTAYDRWWDGRKQFSTLGSNWRNFAMKLNALLPTDDKENREYFAKMITNHAYSFKENIRDGVDFDILEEPVEGFKDRIKKAYHVPNQMSRMMVEKLNQLYDEGVIKYYQLVDLLRYTDIATEVVSSCERIRTTPLTRSYRVHLERFIIIFTVMLPFGFVKEISYWTIPFVMFVYYAMAGLVLIGEEIEDPFGQDENDLPIDNICSSLKKNVDSILLRTERPREITA